MPCLSAEGTTFGDETVVHGADRLVSRMGSLFGAHQAFPEILEMPLGVLGVVEPDAAVSFRPQPCPRLRT